ncbi:MAG: thioredoxin domain-containing protein, partial [Candidatus Omnitrophica bacterium]|nr:thioredoxin domain-containing protein [Candidatus Omnitrophota bacterium]MCB9719639.1 thioredoxin domain-containing protein [Candidatus Omnitrophota bacterium]
MDTKVFNSVMLVVLVVLVAVGIFSKQGGSGDLQQLINQQTAIMQAQNRLEAQLGNRSGDAGASTAVALQMATALSRISDLESRIKSIEGDVKQLAARPAPAAAAPTPQQAPPGPDPTQKYDIPVAHTPVIGPRNAKVTITEFMDMECPFCARFHPPIQQVLKAYPNDVNYMVKNFPLSFHPNAKPAAKAALAAAEQGKYGPMIDKMLENRTALGPEMYKTWAGEIGLNVAKWEKDLKNNDAKYEQIIQKDMQLAAQVGVRGTPTFYINGRVTMARDFNALKAEIDKILSE